MVERTDIVVVGGGLAGLAAAATAAKAGRRVVVLEAHRPGGRAATTERRGYRLNLGPHALYVKGAGLAVLDRLGVAAMGRPPRLEGALGRRGDRLLPFPLGATSILSTRLVTARHRAQLGRALATVARARPEEHADRSFAGWLDDRAWHDDVRTLVGALGRIASYSASPEVVSADVVLQQLRVSLAGGVRYLDGGWQSLVDGLAAVARHGGAEVRDHEGVQRVVEDAGRVEVHLSDRVIAAEVAVVAAGSPQATAALLANPPVWHVGPPVEASTLDLGLRAPAPVPAVFGIDVPLYLVQHAPPAQLAPDGAALVHVAEYLGTGVEPSLTRLEEHAALAGITDDLVVERRHLRRMTVVSAAPTPATGGLRGRPAIEVPGHGHVLVAGDWVGPTGFLADASLASGEQAGLAAARLTEAVRA